MSDAVVRLNSASSHTETSDGDTTVALAAVSSRDTQAALSEVYADIDGAELEFSALGLVPMAALKSSQVTPDVFIFEARDEEQAADWVAALRSGPGAFKKHLVALIPAPTKTATIELLQAGADDVFSIRPDSVEITRTLARARATSREFVSTRGTDPVGDMDTRLVVFIHAAGGAGATTMAVNTAVQLHDRVKDGRGGACMIDLDVQFGDAHLQLDLAHQSRVADLLKSPERLDRRMLDDLMINTPSGLKVFTSPEAPMPLDGLSRETVDRILSLARRRYRYVVVDMPAALAHWTETVLHKADHIFLVTQINVPALRATRRLLDTIRHERVTRAPITIIANRYGGKGVNRLPLQQAARAIDHEIDVVMPNDYQLVMESLDQGVPVSTLRPQSKLTRALSEMLEAIIGARGGPKRRLGFVESLARLGRR